MIYKIKKEKINKYGTFRIYRRIRETFQLRYEISQNNY